MTERIYVYGVAAAGALHTPLCAHGLPDGRSPVTAIAVGGAAAIIGHHVGAALRHLPQAEVLSRLTIHQQVIEGVMERGDVLPAQFGTLLADEAEVRWFLTHWGGLIRESLMRHSGLIEVEVAATWDLEQVMSEVAQEPEVLTAKAAAAQAPSAARLTQQVELGRSVKRALDQRRALFREKLLGEVGPLVRSVQPNAVLADDLVFNVAFLLEKQMLPDFDTAIERLDAALAGSLSFRRIGPLPPYSFATVRIIQFDAERLAAGRALLELPGEITEQAVLSHYRRLARELHPDHNPTDPGAAERFAALHAARTDLLAYHRSRNQAHVTGTGPVLGVVIEPTGSGTLFEEGGDA